MNERRFREAEGVLWASLGVSPSDRRLRLDRSDVTVRVQEVGDGAPVVFLHGASSSGSTFAPVAAQLPGLRCVLLDRPGCGLSQPPARRASVEELPQLAADLVVDVLDALGVASADIVSTSYGGFLALHAAAAHPERVRRIVHLGWSVGAPIARLPMVMRLAVTPGVGRMMAAAPPTRSTVRAMLRDIGLRRALAEGRVSDEVVGAFLSLLRHTDTMRNEVTTGPPIMTPVRGLDDRILLREEVRAAVTAPTYFLWGEEDLFGGPEVAESFVAPIPHGVLEIVPRAGHAVWLDAPELVADRISAFLTPVTAPVESLAAPLPA